MSVCSPKGFVAAGIHCGIKPSGVSDLALVATDDYAAVAAAAVFTSNKATAAPVLTSRAHLAATGGRAAAVVLNSGNANAATGAEGLANSERTCALVAEQLGCKANEVLVCSTGLIGIPLRMRPIEAGVPRLVEALDADSAHLAALAILTTDTVAKEVTVTGDGWTIGGMAKGAAMLAPDMATMLAVLTTDAAIESDALHTMLQAAVVGSFNSMSVDGCTSTNDTVIVLANGRASAPDGEEFQAALDDACLSLARHMAADAEGATKTVTVEVVGARNDAEATVAARRIGDSQLVKCSLYGADPYWGRIVSELGSAGIDFDPDRVSVAYGGLAVCRGGIAADHDEAAVVEHLLGRDITITCDLGLGDGRGGVLTNDLTPAYIDENMRTS